MNRLGDTSAFVIPAGQLLLTRRGKTRIYTVGIVFEFYTVPLKMVRNLGPSTAGTSNKFVKSLLVSRIEDRFAIVSLGSGSEDILYN